MSILLWCEKFIERMQSRSVYFEKKNFEIELWFRFYRHQWLEKFFEIFFERIGLEDFKSILHHPLTFSHQRIFDKPQSRWLKLFFKSFPQIEAILINISFFKPCHFYNLNQMRCFNARAPHQGLKMIVDLVQNSEATYVSFLDISHCLNSFVLLLLLLLVSAILSISIQRSVFQF